MKSVCQINSVADPDLLGQTNIRISKLGTLSGKLSFIGNY
jgi:hypothetical protein